MKEAILDVGSIGYGVQSTAILLMQGLGLLPKTDVNFFSELRETQATIDYIGYITPILTDMGIECKILKPKDIYEHVLNWKQLDRVSMLPVWFKDKNGKAQPLNRGCTADFKIHVVASAIRDYLGVKKLQRNSIRVWQGISTDEIARAKRSSLYPDKAFRINHYPYIGQFANITDSRYKWTDYSRHKLIQDVFIKYGFKVPPKSSCFFCPFHDIEYWYNIFINEPQNWILACELDESIRCYNTPTNVLECGELFLYRGLIPLRNIDFEKELKKPSNQLLLSGCESGFCFV